LVGESGPRRTALGPATLMGERAAGGSASLGCLGGVIGSACREVAESLKLGSFEGASGAILMPPDVNEYSGMLMLLYEDFHLEEKIMCKLVQIWEKRTA